VVVEEGFWSPVDAVGEGGWGVVGGAGGVVLEVVLGL